MAPWYPFCTCLDFDLSEFICGAALNREQINFILKLSRCFHTEECTLETYNNLESTWRATSHCMMMFQESVISVPFAGEMMEFEVHYHSLWDWASDLLKDTSVGPYFVFDAQHLSKFDGSSFVHFIDEPWMADNFWNVQVCC
ncbi:hypothetical protein F5J12DRAFT_728633 [Pisolithus orientalis]|uniref:uncharacterized protein n=1 Tax=Pisolithus orientalis TaxID=936130 RepID=UPI0022241BB7|nr:uncharacterized protein F5J12DRAFT_728633 [Pisolithus orientalis]KAI5986971.1 hypothetical protein F5J12DRAFT_728633 [Pisolithus orientalis]